MARILIVGIGDVGGHLGQMLAHAGHDVVGIRRSDQPLEGIEVLSADVSEPETLEPLAAQAPFDILVYCVASPVFSKEGYHDFYVRGLNHVLTVVGQQAQLPQHAFFVSSSSVYHQKEGEWVDESSATEPRTFSGKEMLAAEQVLLNSAIPGTVVRFTGIYGPGRNRLIEQARHGGHCDPEPPVWTNRIHRDDCVGVLAFLIQRALSNESLDDIYLATDNEPTTLFDVLEWLKDRIGDVEPDADVPEVTRRANRRCSNARLKAVGYPFKYSDYQTGYDEILTDMGLI